MSELIRSLVGSRLPADAIAAQGNYLHGQSIADLMAKQDGVVDPNENPLAQLSRLLAGLRPNPGSNDLQLDR